MNIPVHFSTGWLQGRVDQKQNNFVVLGYGEKKN